MAKKCQGVININENCSNEAKWLSSGYTAQFGVCHTSYVCDSCKELMKKNFRPKIMEYNQFPLEFTKIEEEITNE